MRECLFGAAPARFTEQIGWRAILPIELVPTRVGPDNAVHIERTEYVGWIGPTGHVICYPIRGGELYNMFVGRVSTEWAEESWTAPSTRAEMLAAFAGWNEALLFGEDGDQKWFSAMAKLKVNPLLLSGAAGHA